MDMSEPKSSAFAAYHGGSWQYRTATHAAEMEQQRHWPHKGEPSEWAPLRHALLWAPPHTPPEIKDPERVQHLRPIDWNRMRAEQLEIQATLESHGVHVHTLSADAFPAPPPNLMFVRDHFFISPWGAILGRMASPVRAGEEKWAQLALAQIGIPILSMIHGAGLFEGADALWLNAHTVLVGVGNRTNAEGAQQIKNIMDSYGVQTVVVQLPKSVQHLLGLVQIVDKDSVLVRSSLMNAAALDVLRRHFPNCIAIPESEEVTQRQGFNCVCLRPKTIIMAAHCPQLRALYEANSIQIASEVEMSQYLNAAGGIACATGIVARY